MSDRLKGKHWLIKEKRHGMNQKLKEKVLESLASVLPITGIVLAVSVLLIPMEVGTIAMFLAGAVPPLCWAFQNISHFAIGQFRHITSRMLIAFISKSWYNCI